MRARLTSVLVAAALALGAATPTFAEPSAKEKESARAEIDAMADETLQQLYKLRPSAKSAIAHAAGYAVFSNFGMKIFVAGSGKGEGVAIANPSKKATYMKMMEVQAGLGVGVKKFRLVWVFEKASDFDKFVNSGWELGASTSAAVMTPAAGAALDGAVSLSSGIWLYQLTGEGLALELSAKGTKYYKDKDLN
jgi:lipid-binding SYLF domain-containing protein